jgi:hypothetical protein
MLAMREALEPRTGSASLRRLATAACSARAACLLRTFSTAFVTTLVEKRVGALARSASSAHSTALVSFLHCGVLPEMLFASGS